GARGRLWALVGLVVGGLPALAWGWGHAFSGQVSAGGSFLFWTPQTSLVSAWSHLGQQDTRGLDLAAWSVAAGTAVVVALLVACGRRARFWNPPVLVAAAAPE